MAVHSLFHSQPQFSGFMKPCRFEGQVSSLEVRGRIPPAINGVFYRVMPDPAQVPFIENDPWFNGDGNVSAFHVHDSRVDFRQRYVRTEKFVKERQAGKALLGKYRNKYTDAVEFTVRSTANTNIFPFAGKLLACKEDSPAYRVNPRTLATEGLETFNGELPSCTFTAHPKICPDTGEMLCMGYEAKGDGTPDVCYFNVSPEGKVKEVVWLVAPVVALIHDFAFTENYVLFPLIPQTCDLERLKKGGEHWQWDPTIPFYVGVLPRKGAKGTDVKWFRAPNAFPGHTVNAFENEKGDIVFDLPSTDRNVFFWWPDKDGNAPEPSSIHAQLLRFTIDPKTKNLDLPPAEVLSKSDIEFPRIDDRFQGKSHSLAYFDLLDPSLGTDFARIMRPDVVGGGHPVYNALGKYNYKTNKMEAYCAGQTHLMQEPVLVPRSKDCEEGDGWLVALVNNYETMGSELHIVDTKDMSKAVAIVYLPVRLRAGLHGNWVDGWELDMLE
ncbi:hypothetical protein MKZ38_003064 [Zalerion maritima]|uniref:Uncharacterized protein n=1 Tax=Zalerion maritima TaxID=339359 RepID=A0AAD5RNR3_9PEZI|nr:hypothetical protein MKZ38_003064 [Zalerion maritima]